MRIYYRILALGALLSHGSTSLADINETTDRYIRDLYGCQISTTDNIKPEFSERESAWVSWSTGFADLNNDGQPEVIAGYEHEYSEGYGVWTREPYQYGFYSTDPDFQNPSGTRFLAARTILTQDFNGDNKDDVVFIQHGPDFAPYIPARNEILLSGPQGYSTRYIEGGASLYHGGAAGDFDRDGDVDLVATPGIQNEILILLNNGQGSFSVGRRIRGFGRNYNIKTWDIDGDGHLDLLFDGQEEPLTILWGDGRGNFEDATIVEELSSGDLMQDAVFIDGHNGLLEIASLSSLSVNQPSAGQGFSLDIIRFDGRKVISAESIDRFETPRDKFGAWLNFIHTCDLGADGDHDVIFEFNGNHDRFNRWIDRWLFLDKLVWENETEAFTRVELLNSAHPLIPQGILPNNFFSEKEIAERLGLSLVRYKPHQLYAQRDYDQTLFQRHAGFIQSLVGDENRDWNHSAGLSERARCILAERRGEDSECAPSSTIIQENTPGQSGGRNFNIGAQLSERARCILAERNGEASSCSVVARESVALPVRNQRAGANRTAEPVLSDRAVRILEERRLRQSD